MKTEVENILSTTLNTRRSQKNNKYKPLIEDGKQQFHWDAELLVIIVSSLIAAHKETIDSIKKNIRSHFYTAKDKGTIGAHMARGQIIGWSISNRNFFEY